MKRYLIFAALVPLLGGFWLLLATTVHVRLLEPAAQLVARSKNLFAVFAKTLAIQLSVRHPAGADDRCGG